MTELNLNRRQALLAGAMGAAGLPFLSAAATAQSSDMEYVFLSVVTQVPFWADHRLGLKAASQALGVKTTFTGPLDFDTAAQARQLDELIARRPAGILIFPGDVGALVPGINRAAEAGIPVAMIIGDAPESARVTHLGISNFEAGKVGAQMLAEAIGGKGKVLLGTFPAPPVLERVEGYKAWFAENAPDIEVVDVINDKADPSYAPTAYAQALLANPDVVGIGGTDGDSGKGAAIAVTEAGRKGEVKIVAMDRNDDMLPYIEDGTIHGAVAQKSFAEAMTAVHLLHWLNTGAIQAVPGWQETGANPLPTTIQTGVMRITAENVAQFRH
ncbi:substrate-binding domain-containing protein [Maliponia aquimaris]|uniref:D-ribose-binding periplasmic protein n=1 Tax=Maliponia aquimaris TaxID=1673631 RepID=A0A238KYP1_9RHOB|nr:substrate-binding domain-containing protein [Maliponia aquimaris]SMX47808.1 D-ribose-binding periplasmic protein precursor [Maliponia aquimaris]